MYNTTDIKNYKRTKNKRIPRINIAECSVERPDERTMPYFETVPEQFLADERYLSLTPMQQGHFLRLMTHVMAKNNGLQIRHSGVIAKSLGLSIDEWEGLEAILLEKRILVVTEDGYYLMQHEFREQYLQTLETNNAKRRYK